MGNPDILFCNSGILGTVIGPQGNIHDVAVDEFEHTWRVNTGIHYLVHFHSLLAGESIIHILKAHPIGSPSHGIPSMG